MKPSVACSLYLLPFAFFLGAMAIGVAQPDSRDPYEKQLAKASDEWKKTVQRMKLPAGVKADLWAAEPLVANIVVVCVRREGPLLRRRDVSPARTA